MELFILTILFYFIIAVFSLAIVAMIGMLIMILLGKGDGMDGPGMAEANYHNRKNKK